MFPNELNSMEQDSRSAPIPVASGVDPGAITGSGIPFVERHPIKLEEKILLLPVDEGFDAWSFVSEISSSNRHVYPLIWIP